MFIYFIRHGESVGNIGGFHQDANTPLSPKGIKQAEALSERLSSKHFDFIYSSDYQRAKQTAEIINKKLSLPIEYWHDLAEVKMPSEIKGKNIDDTEAVRIKKMIRDNIDNISWKYSDEESFDELIKRADKIIEHLTKRHSNEIILCVSHSHTIKAVVGRLVFGEELKPKTFLRMREHMWTQNTGITVCENHPKYGWQLNTWNDMLHV